MNTYDIEESTRRVTLWEQGYWEVPDDVDTSNFNFDWRPHKYDKPYIHQFGTQWQKTGGPRFVVPDNEGVKYHHHMIAKHLPDRSKFTVVMSEYDVEFDWSWHPDDTEPAFIWTFGNQYHNSFVMPTVEYRVPGATDRKHSSVITAKLIGKKEYWRELIQVEDYGWDRSWCPDPYEPPYIYVWGNQWNDAATEPTIEYRVPGATERKYMTNFVPRTQINIENWQILIPIDESSFDFSWRPNPHEPPYIYVWGNQWNDATVEPTIEYWPPSAKEQQYFRPVERKYMTGAVPTVLPELEKWHTVISVDEVSFDFSWRPNPHEPPYIYVWGNQWNSPESDPTVEYRTPGASERKYMTDRIARLHSDFESNKENWQILIPVDESSFDFSWRPSPLSPPYIYVWGNQWNDAATEPTIEYLVPGATEYKYMTDRTALVVSDMTKWSVPDKNDLTTFDFTWRPNPYSQPQTYQWENGGPIYTVPEATDIVLMKRDDVFLMNESPKTVSRYYIETTLEDLISSHPDEVFWALNPDLNYEQFDFTWKPDEKNFIHINVFGNKFSKDTNTYYINSPAYRAGHREVNYVEDHEIEIITNVDMFYVLRGNHNENARFEKLKSRYPELKKTRFVNTWVDTIARCLKKSSTKFAWILTSEVDYDDFKFDYYPDSWNREKIHVFGTQWNHWGNTYFVNKETFDNDTQYVKTIEHLTTVNHVRSKKTTITDYHFDLVYIDHENNTNSLERLKNRFPNHSVTVLKYSNSYLNTFKQWISNLPDYSLQSNNPTWICSSLCHYDNFDFSWTPDPFQREQLHVFSSILGKVKQKFGDTFLVNLSVLKDQINDIVDLEKYPKKVNYVSYLQASRFEHLVMYHDHDSQVDAVKEFKNNFAGPYIELINDRSCPDTVQRIVPNVWNLNRASISVGTTGASQILVPRPAFDRIGKEVYDYPYVDQVSSVTESLPIDIVYISNGEPVAEENYRHLVEVVQTRGLKNRVHWVKDVSGRVASQHAAANISNTDWYFLVNGKIRLNPEFDFSWQPDRLQQAKHYIFTATNPVNGLEYGHQAIVANNRRLTLSTVTRGLDFTMDSLHAVVEKNCGVAVYNTDPWTTWRTAFREAIKLRSNDDEVSKERLATWCTVGNGDWGEWSTRGALDAVEYYEQVEGQLDQLMNSYDWQWIQQYYEKLGHTIKR